MAMRLGTSASLGVPKLTPAQNKEVKKAEATFPEADLWFAFSSDGCIFVLFDGNQRDENVGVLDPEHPKRVTSGMFYNKQTGVVQAWSS